MQKYDITTKQKEKLLDDGFTRLSDPLPPELLDRWHKLAESLEAQALDAHARSEQLHGACVIEDPVGPRLMRFDDVLSRDTDAGLAVLFTSSCVRWPALPKAMRNRNNGHRYASAGWAWSRAAPNLRGGTSWLDKLPTDLGSDADEAAAIVAHWEPPIPAFYCNKVVETETYPVPADMRDESD